MLADRAARPVAATADVPHEAPRAGILAGLSGGDWALCGALVAVAAVFRLLLLQTIFAHIDGDQAIVGLMAYHIERGDRPVFYYGQAYQGSLEAYLAALVFRLWGADEWTLRLPTLAAGLLFVALVYLLGRTLYGRRVAVLSGLFIALAPSLLVNYSTAAGYSYIEAMDCGTALLLLAVCYPDPRRWPLPAALLGGLLAGIGLWLQPLIGEYLVAIAAMLALRVLCDRHGRALDDIRALALWIAAITVGTLIGAAPVLLYNLHHGWATLAVVRHQPPSGDRLDVARYVVTEAMPILLGFITPTSVADVFNMLMTAAPLRYWLGVLLGVVLLLRLAFDPRGLPTRIVATARAMPTALPRPPTRPAPAGARPRWSDERMPARVHAPYSGGASASVTPGRDGALALLALACLVFFVFTGFGSMPWATRLPRYLLPLYTVTPLVVDLLLPRGSRLATRPIAVATMAAALVASLASTLAAQPRASIDGLEQALLARGDRVAYGTYWLTNRIAFDTRERVLGIPVTSSLALGQERVAGYVAAARRAPAGRVAWVLDAGSQEQGVFGALLQRYQISVHELQIGSVVIYDRLSRPLSVANSGRATLASQAHVRGAVQR